jgi:N-methylhydantoinase B
MIYLLEKRNELDPVTLEIQWRRLVTIMDETDKTVIRTAFSTIIGESGDFACVMTDSQGRGLAQSTFSTTLFTVTLPRTVRFMLSEIPPETLEDGDVLITNDPWHGAGHLPDVCVATPVFRKGRLAAFVGTVAHLPDIGGHKGYFNAREVYEEGLQIPPVKLYRAGEPNDDVFDIISSNVRTSKVVIGDLRGIVSAGIVGKRRLLEMMDDYDLGNLSVLADNILHRSEQATRRAIEAIADGEYTAELEADGYDRPLKIRTRIAINGSEMLIDLAGSSEQFDYGAINCTLNATSGDTLIAMKSMLVPELPNNEGQFAPITVTAPEGSVFNCRYPAAVQARSVAVVHLHDAIYMALARAAPQLVHAGTGTFWAVVARGRDEAGEDFNVSLIPDGGLGACGVKDGLACIRFPGNGSMAPAEVVENRAPILIFRKELTIDSAGAGKQRGGLGQAITLRCLSSTPITMTLRPNNMMFPPPGLSSGRDGPRGAMRISGDRSYAAPVALVEGDEIEMVLPGGGGFGNPVDRNPDLVARDVSYGYVSKEAALAEYGVVVDSALRVDESSTRIERDRRRRRRGV